MGKVLSAEARQLRSPLEYGILGPVDVRGDHGSIPLGGALQRALLGDLALHANQVLSADRLVTDLWVEPPSSAPKMVQILVSRLRRAIGDNPAAPAIVTRPAGYELRVDPDHLDLARFERLVDAGAARMPADPDRAARDLRSALDLWRGPALSDVRDAPFAASAVTRLDELRYRAFESWADAELAAGQHASLIAELRAAVAAEPLRERTRGQLMLALYRSGRQADALQLFVETRRYLVSEMGIEPSGELTTLQAAILAQDPALDPPPVEPAAIARRPGGSASEPAHSSSASPAVARARRLNRASASLVVLGIAVVVTAGLAFAGSVLPGTGPPAPRRTQVVGNSVAAFDIPTERVVADIPVGQDPGAIGLDDAAAWVANVSDRTMSKVDRVSTRVLKTFGLPGAPVSVTVGDGMVWIGNSFDGTLDRITTSYDQLAGPMWPSGEQRGLLAVAASPSDLWVGLANDELVRVDPTNLSVKTTFALAERAQSIAMLGSTPWYVGHAGHAAHEVDPANLLAPRDVPFTGDGRSIVSGAGSIWVSTDVPEQLVEIDPASAVVKRIVPLGVPPRTFALDGDAAWVVAESGTLERVDLVTNEVRVYDLGRPIQSLAFSGSQLWLTVR